MRSEVRRTAKLVAVLLSALLVLALFTTPRIYRLAGSVEYARHIRVNADIQVLRFDLAAYKSRNGNYPTTAQGLAALALAEIPRDPWGNEYVYHFPGWSFPHAYELFSAGPDGVPDTADDDWGD